MKNTCISLSLIAATIFTHLALASSYQAAGSFTAMATGDGAPRQQFGTHVAIDGDLAVVATLATSVQPAKVHTFERINAIWTRRPDQSINLPNTFSVISLSVKSGFLIVCANGTGNNNIRIHRRNVSSWTSELNTFTNTSFFSCAIDGNIAVAGRDANGGAANAYRRDSVTSTWSAQSLTPSVAPSAGFGTSVAIVAGAVVVGSPLEDITTLGGVLRTDAGAAYVFELTQNTWTQAARLAEPDADVRSNNQFGAAVAISGADTSTPDRLLIASKRVSSSLSGRVRSYTRTAGVWTARTVITSTEPAGSQDGFGCALKLDGDWAVVGACESNVSGNAEGAATVLRFNSTFTGLLSATQRVDTLADDNFSIGASLAIDRTGPTVLLGNPRARVYGNQLEGAVLVGRGIVGGTIAVPARAMDLGQGLTLARAGLISYDGGTLAVTAYGEAIGNQNGRGAVYVHQRDSNGFFPLEQKILAPDGAAFDSFGSAPALVGDSLLVGAPERANQGINAVGAVYAFRRSAGFWALEAQLIPANPSAQQQFGRGLAFDGATAVVCTLNGESYVYTRAGDGTWSLTQTIAHACETPQLDGDRLVLNNPFATLNGAQNIGSVSTYVRVSGMWQLQSTLFGAQAEQRFGYQIASENDLLVVTSTGPSGARAPAQLYRTSGGSWLPESTLQPNDAGLSCYTSAMSMGRVFLGCPAEIAGRQAVYVFERLGNAWQQTQKLSDATRPNAGFGGAIRAYADGSLFVAGLNADLEFIGQGIAYRFFEPPLLRDGFE